MKMSPDLPPRPIWGFEGQYPRPPTTRGTSRSIQRPDPARDADRTNHTRMVRYGSDTYRAPSLVPAARSTVARRSP